VGNLASGQSQTRKAPEAKTYRHNLQRITVSGAALTRGGNSQSPTGDQVAQHCQGKSNTKVNSRSSLEQESGKSQKQEGSQKYSTSQPHGLRAFYTRQSKHQARLFHPNWNPEQP
jgi:hypothetical protein